MAIQQEAPFQPKIYPLGDSAIVLQFGETISKRVLDQINQFIVTLNAQPLQGIIEYVQGYTTLTIYYNPWVVSKKGKYDAFEKMKNALLQILAARQSFNDFDSKKVQIPVCYESEFGPDLDFVAQHNHLTPEEVISIHTENEYLVYMIGFAPGFPYLGGMNKKIAAPRKKNPRLAIPAGSVGIAGEQTGVYPIETPGGWQLIGRTPHLLFNANQQSPSLLQAGDVVQFVSISKEEFHALKEAPDGY